MAPDFLINGVQLRPRRHIEIILCTRCTLLQDELGDWARNFERDGINAHAAILSRVAEPQRLFKRRNARIGTTEIAIRQNDNRFVGLTVIWQRHS